MKKRKKVFVVANWLLNESVLSNYAFLLSVTLSIRVSVSFCSLARLDFRRFDSLSVCLSLYVCLSGYPQISDQKFALIYTEFLHNETTLTEFRHPMHSDDLFAFWCLNLPDALLIKFNQFLRNPTRV